MPHNLFRLDFNMAEAAQGTQHEFWRPPSLAVGTVGGEVVAVQTAPTMADACRSCGTEFLLGSHFCHSCGGKRPEALSAATQVDAAVMADLWQRGVRSAHVALTIWRRIEFPSWLRYLHFHEIKSQLGLSTASLIAFVMGLGCIAGALLVGLLTARNLVDWEAIQFYRAEWLLAATASFVAGILLKKRSDEDSD
jgi:hypothetical protein